MSSPIEVLFIDDEEHLRRAAGQMLDLAGHTMRAIASPGEALTFLSRTYPGILVSDIRMPEMDGMELLRQAIAIDPDLPVLLVTGHGDIPLAVEAMRQGAYDFIEKPFSKDRFLESVTRAMDKRRLTLENRQLRANITNRQDDLELRLAGRSAAMLNIRRQIRMIASTPADVLIIGDTGTGKEIVARAIHDLTSDKERPFIAINCAALPADMIEAELFGYEAGAFPGATRARFGKFEHARNGTIFLDQAHAMSTEMQAKLLRVVQERTITRLGSTEPIALNCRFIAASNIDLEDDAATGNGTAPVFSRDLLYRFNVMTLRLPPLSAHKEDIPLLFVQLVAEAATRYRIEPADPSDALMAHLMTRDWPGNIRELRNAAERFALGLDAMDGNEGEMEPLSMPLRDRVAAFERETIAAELRARSGRLSEVHTALGISRKNLYEKMQKYGLLRADFRK